MQNKKILFILIFIAISCTFPFCKKVVKKTSILTVQTVIGDVTIQSDGISAAPTSGQAIKENSIIKTGKLSIIDIKYKNNGIVRVNENSDINISTLFSSGDKDDTVLEMSEGRVFVAVTKIMKDSSMQVKTPTSVAGVRGTAFRVSAENGVSRIDVLKGTVKVNPVKDNNIINTVEKIVEANNTVQIDEKSVDSIVEEKKDTIEVTSLREEEVETIREEARFVKLDNSLNDEIKNEIKEIGIESKAAEEIKDNKEYEREVIEQLGKIQVSKEREAELKEKELKEQEQTKEKERAIEKRRLKEKKAAEDTIKSEEKAKLETLEKERIENEKKIEIHKQEQVKEQKKKEEERVKNIPNF